MVNYILSKSPNGLFLIFERSVQFDFTIRQLNFLQKTYAINGVKNLRILNPDKNNDWINHRDEKYQKYPSITGEKYSPFIENAMGVQTNRDAWVYGFSKNKLEENVKRFISNYNVEADKGLQETVKSFV